MQPIGMFKGERALVTGSASNIGRAIAVGLSAECAHVLLADVDPVRNSATLQAIEAAGGSAATIETDLSTRDGWKALIDRLGEQPLDMFVHSAAPPRKEADHVMDVSEDVFDAMLNVNLRSGFFLARTIGRRMQQARI